jgi:hypothetical protein
VRIGWRNGSRDVICRGAQVCARRWVGVGRGRGERINGEKGAQPQDLSE